MNLVTYYIVIAASCVAITLAQECYEKQTVNGIEIEWKYSIDDKNEYYYTNPLCLDASGLYILRYCKNGNFIDQAPPNCWKLQMSDYACMEGLELQYSKAGPFCYTISARPMSFDEQFECPYKHVDAIDTTEYFFILADQNPIWLPFHRQDVYKGTVGYFIPDGLHGTVFEPCKVANNTKQIQNQKCLSVHAGLLAGDCDKQCYRACIYRAIPLKVADELIHQKQEADVCRQYNGQNSLCRASWQKDSIVCLCPTPFNECEYPTFYPTAPVGCGIGLTVTDNSLKSFSKQTYVANGLWSIDNLQIKLLEHIISTETGWTTIDHIDCVMCERNHDNNGNSITLKYDTEEMKPHLLVANPYSVFSAIEPKSLETYNFKCFMEAAGIIVSFERMMFPGLWQCESIDIADTSHKYITNILQLDAGRYIFSIQLVADIESKNIEILYPILDKLFDEYSSNLIHWIEVSDETDTWVEVLYRFDVSLEDDFEYRIKCEALNEALLDTNLAHLKPRAYNQMFCEGFTTNQQGNTFIWPMALVDDVSQTDCFDETGFPLLIECKGDFTIGARFSPVPECISFTHNFTDVLSNLENSTGPPDKILSNLTIILKLNHNLTTQEFDMTANILEKWCEEANLTNVIKVVNRIMMTNPEALENSQKLQNVTDRVLYSLDTSLQLTQIDSSEETLVIDQLEAAFINTSISIYTGTAYLTTGKMIFLNTSYTIEEILELENLESAVYISTNTTGLSSITKFNSSVLFNEKQTYQHAAYSKVLGVLLPEDSEDTTVTVVFKSDQETKCAYWLYGSDSYGSWKLDNNILLVDNYTICTYNHTTHYGLLIMTETPLEPASELVLSIFTAIESGLSIAGLSIILATAVIFPMWRHENAALIHYCTVLLVQTLLLFINSNTNIKGSGCIVIGALLQFTVLSQFCWMAMIAVHKYQKLILVYQSKSSRWKSMWMAFTYGVPFVIVVVALIVDAESYTNSKHLDLSICYPSGNVLIFSLILPSACVSFANGCLFIWIVYKLISQDNKITYLKQNWFKNNSDKLANFAIMVFTLGITWWLGFAALFFNSSVLLYLFSITTGLQGFLIFIINIVGKEDVRFMYLRKYKNYRLK